MEQAIRTYLSAVEREFKTGIAAEHAYRPALESLLEAIEDGLNAVNDPKRSEIGAPDFQVLRHNTTIGFVEAKDIGIGLNKIEKTEQMSRYLAGFGNLILTDYLEFRWYVRGEHQQTVRVADVDKKRIQTDETQFDSLAHMLKSFTQVSVPTVNTAWELAQRMAANAHLIRDLIFNDLESKEPSTSLTGQRNAFKKTLLPDIDNVQFADMYAQTIAYGLFAARVNYKGKPAQFSRRDASEDIPRTNPFLRKLFSSIGLDLGDRVTFLVDILADLLARTDMDAVLKDFGKATRQEDPVVHFYETFLREYDPRLREQRGVYYTPEPVVSYIVRSVDQILRVRLGRVDGLADTNTLILDPATGTGTFLYFVMKQIHEAFAGQAGIWSSYVREHMLRRIFGFELLMAPYAVAHMKLGLLLNELGYTFSSDQRLGVYLTNTLEEATKTSETLFAQFISEEADEASAVKRDKPIMVVLGNPPYSGHSANKSETNVDIKKGDSYISGWIPKKDGGASPVFQRARKDLRHVKQPTFIGKLIRDYYFVDSKKLDERNSKWLQNDYVKFIRFGQWRINETGSGVLAFITDNSYLDNVTFRGMRQQLMNTFSDIYILDLHGNSNKEDHAPDGSIDQNVFDIKQGVSIALFVKHAEYQGLARVHYFDLHGKRKTKYQWLFDNDIGTTAWETIEPVSPNYFFNPRDNDLKPEYEQGWKITEILQRRVLGFQSHRDSVAIGFNKRELRAQVESYLDRVPDGVRWAKHAVKVDYRPFDTRYGYLDTEVTDRPRHDIVNHVLSDNLVLNLVRQTKLEAWQHALVSSNPTPAVFIEIKDGSSMFPLYLYPEKRDGELFSRDDDSEWTLSDKGRRPNLNRKFVDDMVGKLKLEFISDGKGDLLSTFGPEDIFAYTYAVFHSYAFRERYAEFLKIDFPILPLTSNVEVFRLLVMKGMELLDLHLMRSSTLERLTTTYQIDGNNQVESDYPKYTHENQRVWINAKQCVEDVPTEVWELHVGGYQVLDRWLKDRRGRVLSYDDIRHYQRIVVALTETLRLMDEIDEAIPRWPLE